MKIAYVVHTFDMGGLERIVAYLCNGLDRSRYEPMIVCLARTGTASRWLNRTDVPIIELHKSPGRDWKVSSRLAAVLRDSRVDIVHSHNWGTLVETMVAARKAGGVPHVHAEHGTVMGGSTAGGLRRWINGHVMRYALGRCSRVVVVATEVRDRLQRLTSFPPEKTTLITNGVAVPDCRSRQTAREELHGQLGIPSEAEVIGSLGRLSPVKCFANAIQCLARLRRRGRNAHLILVGEGGERSRLEQVARDEHVADQVHLPGSQANVGPWLAAMDLYLNTSSSEGMNLGILEAMGSGLPVVATDVGGNRALVDGPEPCGMIVPFEDPDALDQAVMQILGDRDLQSRLGAQAIQKYRSGYSIEQMLQRYCSIYDEVSGSQSGIPDLQSAATTS